MLSNCGAEEESWESLDRKEIKPVNPKGNQSWIFIGRTDAKTEARILWPPNVKTWLIGKDSGAGKDWMQEEKGTAEDEMVGWHQRLNGHEFEQAPVFGDGQGSLACCSPWDHRVGHNWVTELNLLGVFRESISSLLVLINCLRQGGSVYMPSSAGSQVLCKLSSYV